MAVNLSPVGGVAGQFFDNNGDPLVGGKLYTYAAGTTTPQTTYTSSLGTTPNSNPIILNAGGRVPSEIWLTDGLSYKFVLYTSTDQLVGSWDDISGINSNFVNFTSSQEIQTATSGQTVFTLTTMEYQPGTNSLTVYVDGVNQYGPGAQYAYVETDSTTVTFNAGLHVGAEVKFTTVEQATSSATDAASVAYTPAGTGAVTTNVQAKLRETVSVKDFGAVGDGVTDDSVAILAAATQANISGATVFLPAGVYLATVELTAALNNVSFAGDPQGTFWQAVNAGEFALTITGAFTEDPPRRCVISNIVFTGSSKSRHGVQLNIGSHVVTENLVFDDCCVGFLTNGTIDLRNYSMHFIGCDVGYFTTSRTAAGAGLSISDLSATCVIEDRFSNQHSGEIQFFGASIEQCRVGYYQEQPDAASPQGGVQFFGGVIQQNQVGIWLENAGNEFTRPVVVHDTWMEAQATSGTETVSGNTADCGDFYHKTGRLELSNIALTRYNGEANAICHLDGVLILSIGSVNTLGTITGDRIIGDSIVNTKITCYQPSSYRDKRPFVCRQPLKALQSWGHAGNAWSETLVTGSTLTDFGVPNSVTDVVDGKFTTQECKEYDSPALTGGYISYTSAINKWYVIAFAVRCPAGDITLAGRVGGASVLGNFTFDVGAEWREVCAIVENDGSTTGGATFAVTTASGDVDRVWRISGLQVVEFNSRQEAEEFAASQTFILT